MAGRKRSNPQRLDIENEAKRLELSFYQHIPRDRPVAEGQVGCVSSHPASSEVRDGRPLSDIENTSSQAIQIQAPATGKKRKGKGKKKSKPQVYTQTPRMIPIPPTLSEETLALLPTIHSPRNAHHCSMPLFHPRMPGLEAYQIQLSRDEHEDAVCIAIGKMVIALDQGIPLNRLYDECGVSLRFYLESTESPYPPSLLMRIGDGTRDVYIKVNEVCPSLPTKSRWHDPGVRKMLAHSKCVRLAIAPICENTPLVNKLNIEVWAMESLCEVSSPSESVRLTGNVSAVGALVHLLHPRCLVEQPSRAGHDGPLSVVAKINQFYKDVQVRRRVTEPTLSTLFDASVVSGLSAQLRGYQCEAVGWMLKKEGVMSGGDGGSCETSEGCVEEAVMDTSQSAEEPLHKLWKELPIVDQGLQKVYFNPFSGKFSKRRFSEALWPKGGILADEMGLGKTVEILALIMAHRWPRSKSNSTEHEIAPVSKLHPPSSVVTTDSISVEDRPASGSEIVPPPTLTEKQDSICEDSLSRKTETEVTIDKDPNTVVTPGNADRGSNEEHPEVIQCLCGAAKEDEREFVQCERCHVWQHSSCADYNAEKHGEHFYCIKCLLDKPLPSGATLIISPQSIAQQWMDEINKHTQSGAIKAYLYQGVSQRRYVSPLELSCYDIVLVSYETLRNEFYHATSHEISKTLRKRKRYACFPSPLPALLWWRVCLDEAQMVESTNVRAAEMTMKLSAVNRWCVTGTPVQRQLLDLYGLLLFLGVDPYYQSVWFSRLVWEPFLHGNEDPMINLFARVMWRNSKADVADELNLPDHSEQIHWLSFSSVEAYFYRRQQETCFTDLNKVLQGLSSSSTLASLVQTTVNKLMIPLHSLRQACCHPQIVRSGSYLPTNNTNRNYITMPKLLEKLSTQAKVEAREGLRQLVAALNGLAAVHILKEEREEAVGYYREAMTAWQDHLSHDVECDKLQRIHTMENLAQMLEAGHGGEDHTLRDSQLMEEANALRSKFSEKVEGQVKAAAEGLFLCKENIDHTERESNWLLAEHLDEIPAEIIAEVQKKESSADEPHPYRTDTNDEPHPSRTDTDDEPCTPQVDTVDEPCPPQVDTNEPCPPQVDTTDEPCPPQVDTADEPRPPQEDIADESHLAPMDTVEPHTPQMDTADQSHPAPMDTVEPHPSLTDTEGEPRPSPTNVVDEPRPSSTDTEDPTSNDDLPLPSDDVHSQATNQIESEGCGSIEGEGPAVSQGQRLGQTKESPKPIVHPSNPWWFVIFDWITAHSLEEELLDNISLDFKFRDLRGLLFFICDHTDKIQSSRHTVLSFLDKLSAPPSPELVTLASDCHLQLRRGESVDDDKLTEPCPVCITEIETIKHERYLFSQYENRDVWVGLHSHGNSDHHGDGSRRPGKLEMVIRTIVSFAKQKRAPPKLLEAGQALLTYIDALKKEYTAIRTLWMALDERLCTCDELDMASTRLRFMTTIEWMTNREIPSAINPYHVPYKIIQFESDKASAERDLKKCLGQVLYLKNLAKVQDKPGAVNSEPCPVCTQDLGREWAMFSCGHPLCVECTSALIRRQPRLYYQTSVNVKCPLCREFTLSSEINYIKDIVEDEYIQIKGCHSTKIIAVISTLAQIQQTEPGAKSLVFSTWLEVLDLIARALNENGIKYKCLKYKKSFQENLSEFKSSPDINVLLLPFHSGSKGLNIVEASHVLLVEPLINIGAELQAIGRVQRMGQTRPTKVHRFHVRDTVEEKIYSLLNSHSDRTKFIIDRGSESQLTVSDIRGLFDC